MRTSDYDLSILDNLIKQALTSPDPRTEIARLANAYGTTQQWIKAALTRAKLEATTRYQSQISDSSWVSHVVKTAKTPAVIARMGPRIFKDIIEN